MTISNTQRRTAGLQETGKTKFRS